MTIVGTSHDVHPTAQEWYRTYARWSWDYHMRLTMIDRLSVFAVRGWEGNANGELWWER